MWVDDNVILGDFQNLTKSSHFWCCDNFPYYDPFTIHIRDGHADANIRINFRIIRQYLAISDICRIMRISSANISVWPSLNSISYFLLDNMDIVQAAPLWPWDDRCTVNHQFWVDAEVISGKTSHLCHRQIVNTESVQAVTVSNHVRRGMTSSVYMTQSTSSHCELWYLDLQYVLLKDLSSRSQNWTKDDSHIL